jgi:hypothetical protein
MSKWIAHLGIICPLRHLSRVYNALVRKIRERYMPRYGQVKWNGYKVRLFAEERDLFRLFPIVPFFWDSNINLDMVCDPPKEIRKKTNLSLSYKWELYDVDDKVVKSGQDVYEFKSNIIAAIRRKHRAIKIGLLKPQQYYRLNITLTDIYGSTSEPLKIASFSIKDRDEVYTRILIALITIIMGIIIGFLVRGC